MGKGEQANEEMVKDLYGQILRDSVEVRSRFTENFEHVLNMEDVREATINVSGCWLMPAIRELNEREISTQQVRKAVNEMMRLG